MGGALAWMLSWRLLLLLLLLSLQKPGSQGSSCSVFSGVVDWAQEFEGTCLNFSGLNLSLPANQSLRASSVQTLDLSATGLRELPLHFFAQLDRLQLLDVTDNQLRSVAGALAARCGLDLRADCGCALLPWHRVRQDNCSGQQAPQCLLRATGAWQNLSAFLESKCPTGLSPTTIGAIAAGGVLVLGLAVAGPLLLWRLRGCRGAWGLQGSRGARSQGRGKAWGAQDGCRPSSGAQPRYSSRGHGAKAPAATLPGTSTPDYENIFVDQQADEPRWAGHGAQPAEEGDFYMNFEGGRGDSQPVYCNLQSLRRAAQEQEEYVVPGR